jgi:general secretion pathway protein C
MTSPRTPILVHVVGAAAASALFAFWALRLFFTPAEAVLPVATTPVPSRDPDTRLAARLMGDVNAGAIVSVLNVQLSGVYAAGADSSAIVAIDGKPPRAVLLGQEVAAGTRLVEVRPDGITLERDGARSRYTVPPIAVAKASLAVPTFRREGRVLTAPSQDVAPLGKSALQQRSFAGGSNPLIPSQAQNPRPDEVQAPGAFGLPGSTLPAPAPNPRER